MADRGMINDFGTFPFNTIACGELAGSATAAQFPNIKANGLVIITARSDNAGNVYIGGAGVTKPDGTTDITTGLQLGASASITLNLENLNLLWRICDNAGDDLTYLVLR